MTLRERLTDNDKHFGPFTWGGPVFDFWCIKLSSGGTYDGEPVDADNHLTIYAFNKILRIDLPNLIQTKKEKIIAQYWDEETIKRLGRNYYWEHTPRIYGISLFENHISVYYGLEDIQQWSRFIPFTEWETIKTTLYDTNRKMYWSMGKVKGKKFLDSFNELYEKRKSCPKRKFLFLDYDGTEIIAETHIEERIYKKESKWFDWLTYLLPKRVERYLELQFDKEVGPDKHEWKGGTLGHSIDILPNETHESAFRRYCQKEHSAKYNKNYKITYIKEVV